MKIFICGDSTAASYAPEQAPLTGWGQALGELLPQAQVVNKAMAGRSTKSYLSEGRLVEVYRPAVEQLRTMGEEASRNLYTHVEAGVYADYPNGQKDDVHTQRAGAEFYARLVADGLQALKLV